jgi:NAD(P)H-flavin reductase
MTSVVAPAMLPEPARITRVLHELDDTVTFVLEVDRPGGFRFEPGQFNMLYLFGGGEVAVSISGDPTEPESLVHTIRSVGSVTRPMTALARGAVVGVRGPYGTAWPMHEARGKDVVFVAGGLGLAPLRPAIYAILADRASFGRVTLLYGARGPDAILYAREIERWRAEGAIDVALTVDRAKTGWTGQVGVVTALVDVAPIDAARTVAFVCGPEVMMRFVARALERRGVPFGAVWVSMERNMRCAVGLCGHCQLGGTFVCKDGPVFRYDRVRRSFLVREL